MTYQHTYAKLFLATDGATAGQLQMPQAIIPVENTQLEDEDDSSLQPVVPTNKAAERQARRSYSRYFSYAFGFSLAVSIGIGLGLTPQDAYASDLATELAAAITSLTPYVAEAIKGIVGLGTLSFAIIFVVGVVKVIRAVL